MTSGQGDGWVRREVGLILLAAGNASRMGTAKQLLDYQGQPLVRRAVVAGLVSPCRPLFVVLGAEAPRVRAVLDGLPVTFVENPNWSAGMGSSVRAGIQAALRWSLGAVVIGLADQPFVGGETYERLVHAHRSSLQPIVAAHYDGTLGVPALFSCELFPTLLQLDPAEGCRRLLREHPERVLKVECPEAAIDLDTPDDYHRLLTASNA